MIVGPRGVGTSTLIDLACTEYNLKQLKLFESQNKKFEADTLDRKLKKL